MYGNENIERTSLQMWPVFKRHPYPKCSDEGFGSRGGPRAASVVSCCSLPDLLEMGKTLNSAWDK